MKQIYILVITLVFLNANTFGISDNKRVQLLSEHFYNETKSLYSIPKEPLFIKDEFETNDMYQERMTKERTAYNKEIDQLEQQLSKLRKNAFSKAFGVVYGYPILTYLKYNAEKNYFDLELVSSKQNLSIPFQLNIPLEKARSFKQSVDNLKPTVIFDYQNDNYKIASIEVNFDGNSYVHNFMKIDNTLETNDDLKILLSNAQEAQKDSRKWLIVIGIEEYDYTDNIMYAKESANMMKEVGQKVLGVPEENVYALINEEATQSKIKLAIKRLLRRVQDGDTIYFYYNGHGIPIPSKKNEPYMLAYDSSPDFIADETFFSLQNIYTQLSDSNASKVIAFIDSCFSGVTDGKAVLKGVAATRVKPKQVDFNKDKMVVISAGKGHQYSNGYDKKRHRLFSYFILKNLLEGNKSIDELYINTKKETYKTSIKEYGDLRAQEPTVNGNFNLDLF